MKNKKSNLQAFTLIELLVVIAIIGVLASFTLVVTKSVTRTRKISTAKAELGQIEAALDNYKAKYGNYPPGNGNNALLNQLYYELSGTTTNGANNPTYTTLDGANQITGISATFSGVSGFLNSTKGNGEDVAAAKNFLPGLKNNMMATNGSQVVVLVTSDNGPDATYTPLIGFNSKDGYNDNANPIRYLNPGVENPGAYDLWVQLVINGKTNLVCNWSKAVQINTAFP